MPREESAEYSQGESEKDETAEHGGEFKGPRVDFEKVAKRIGS